MNRTKSRLAAVLRRLSARLKQHGGKAAQQNDVHPGGNAQNSQRYCLQLVKRHSGLWMQLGPELKWISSWIDMAENWNRSIKFS